MAFDKNRPVWITGQVTKTTNRSHTLHAVNRVGKLVDVTISNCHIQRQRGDNFLVPQIVAHQAKLKYFSDRDTE